MSKHKSAGQTPDVWRCYASNIWHRQPDAAFHRLIRDHLFRDHNCTTVLESSFTRETASIWSYLDA